MKKILLKNSNGDAIKFIIKVRNENLIITPLVGNGFDGLTGLMLEITKNYKSMSNSILLNGRQVKELVEILQVWLKESMELEGLSFVIDTSFLGE